MTGEKEDGMQAGVRKKAQSSSEGPKRNKCKGKARNLLVAQREAGVRGEKRKAAGEQERKVELWDKERQSN